MKNFLDISNLSTDELLKVIKLGLKIKEAPQDYHNKLLHKKMILLLEKNSTRTRISFEFAIKELGGHCCVVNSENSQISRGESIEDTAKVFDRYADVVVARTFEHERLLKIAKNSSCVINALTDKSHPCQILADIMTVFEQKGDIKGKKVAWLGDVNNVLYSWIEAAEKLDFFVNICCPEKLASNILSSKNCTFVKNKFEAAKDCDVVTTDTWVSMGENKKKIALFDGFTIDKNLMSFAKSDAIFLHCLPAYRGYEVSSDIMDNEKYSNIIFDEAENRLHIQKAILMYCFDLI